MSAITLEHGRAPAAMLQFLQQSSAAPTSRDSLFFGVSADGRLLDARSFYRVPAMPNPQDRLCFDVSNNRIACSVNEHGLLERFAIQVGVAPIETKASPVGAYVEKMLARGGPLPLSVWIGDEKPIALHELGQPEIHLQDDLFPHFEWGIGAVRLKMLVFAPQAADTKPRAIFATLMATSQGSDPPPVHIAPLALQSSDPNVAAPCTMLLVDAERGWSKQEALQPITIRSTTTTLALLMDATEEELEHTYKSIVALTAKAWFDKTREYHLARYGQLRIPEAPFYAELYVRAAELTRQSLMLDGTGEFGGSFNGSDLPAAANIWMRDCFYSALPQSFLCPDLARSAIQFFLDHSIPSHPLGEHADRFPGAKGVTNSLGNSVAGIVLAGMHYQNNNDRQFFLDHPELLRQSISILNQILQSRREDAFLFPSIYVSDGESRGDFHTGSNIFLWRAFSSVERLADEVYGQSEVAALWHAYADRLHQAIITNCIVMEAAKPRFVEGAMQDHTKISGHDGEESDLTLAAFYDFCEVDSPAYLDAAREATSPANPYAIAELEGIWWYAHGKWSSATFPGWMTALAGSQDEAEMLRHLERIRTLTDADGSFWWWPHPHDSKVHLDHPLRTNSKCGWAAGVYLCLFTRHILGLSVDAPERIVRFHPFLPWSQFSWQGCRLGSMKFDCSYKQIENEISVLLRNAMPYPVNVKFEVILPDGAQPLPGQAFSGDAGKDRYDRQTRTMAIELEPGETGKFAVQFLAPPIPQKPAIATPG
jgi:hypothetical protein